MRGIKINICTGLSVFILSACITLHQDIYKSNSSKYIRILSDSTFIFWADSPLLFGERTDRYSNGMYSIKNGIILFNSKNSEIIDSFKLMESNDFNYYDMADSCQSLLITIKFLRSQYTLPTRIYISAFSLNDSISFSSLSDSIILLQCKNNFLAKRLSNEITVYYVPANLEFNKIVFNYLDKNYKHFLSDSINHLDITAYEKRFDTLEYRTFINEEWNLRNNRLIDPITKEEYVLWKSHNQEQKDMKFFYETRIKESYLFNKESKNR